MNILNLNSLNVINVKENDFDYCITVEPIEKRICCTHCGTINEYYRFGFKNQLYMDLPMHNKRVGILVNRQRYRCRACNGTFFVPMPDIDDKRLATKRLIEYIEKQSLKRTFVSIADDVGMDEKTVRNIFSDYVQRLEKEFTFKIPKWLGIDEIHILNKPRCVITNIKECTAIDMLRDRNKSTVVAYLQKLVGSKFTLQKNDGIELVSMDMWNPYRDAVNLVLPHSKIIVDKFHVLRLANTAVETVRKDLRESLTKQQRRGLMHDRFVLLKRNKDLNTQERIFLDVWTTQYKELGAAYWLKLTTAIENWDKEVFMYFSHRVTNAYTESLNNLIRVINRIGRGYSFDALRAKLLFSEGLHKDKRPKYNREAFTMKDELPGLFYDRSFKIYEASSNYQICNLGVDISTLCKKIEEGYFD
ncbi:MAG TPA: ISL3 family transposase [Sedimentibacter sp.]|nr:ISL3 family transposase [Sedimentibacter sp.]